MRVDQSTDLTLLKPGASWPESIPESMAIESGRKVSSYLLVYIPTNDSVASHQTITGSVSFQKRILGVVVQGPPLEKSDQLFGASEIDYDSLEWRRLERDMTHKGRVPPDSVFVSEDGNHLYFDLHVSTGQDCIRVLVDESGAF
jgi:hypothetical protein